MAGMLELPGQGFKTMINVLRALMDRVDTMSEQMDNVSRDGNPKKEPKRNGRDLKTKIKATNRKELRDCY